MSFKILYVTATSQEADTLKNNSRLMVFPGGYSFGNIEVNILCAGVGSVSTSWAMKQWLSVNEKPDLCINAGIAGSYRDEIAIGDVVMPVTDCFADAGIEEGNRFLTLFEAGLTDPDEFPFSNGVIKADTRYNEKMKGLLKPVTAITVNAATGSETTRKKLVQKFNPDIETMEGATFFYICARENIPFLALRSVSNKVEPRDKSKWNITLALDKLSEKINEVLIRLE
jgi:futalosine hydrolase